MKNKPVITAKPVNRNNSDSASKGWCWPLRPFATVAGFFYVTPISPEEVQDTLRRAEISIATADQSIARADENIKKSIRLEHEIDEAVEKSAKSNEAMKESAKFSY